MIRALKAEFLKLKGSKVPLWTALAIVAYSLLPIAGTFMFKDPAKAAEMGKVGGAWSEAYRLGYYSHTWGSLLRQNVQGIAGGIALILFSFVAAYVFGRERKEGTDATMLTAPVSRRYFIVAKLAVVGVWMLALTLFWFVLQTAGFALGAPSGFEWSLVWRSLGQTLQAMLLLFAMMPLVAFVALLGKPGYLKPMVASMLLQPVNPIGTTENAHLYVPTMPILIDGASWLPVVKTDHLTAVSWLIAAAVFLVGAALVVWRGGRNADAR